MWGGPASSGPSGGSAEGSFKARAGALTLFFLCSPLDRATLLALLAEAATGIVIVEEIELPSERDQIDTVFADRYLLEPADPDLDPDDIDENTPMQPTPAGREVPFAGAVLQRWLSKCPSRPLELDDESGEVLGPLITGWGSGVIHALAAGPLTAVEACEAVDVLPLEVVEERLEMMEEAGQVEVVAGAGDESRYAVTDWLRAGIAPLAVAARMEHRHPPGDTAPISAKDVEAVFHLVLPPLKLPEDLRGSCSLAVELDEGVIGSPSGVTAHVDRGRVLSCETRLDEGADCAVGAAASDWLEIAIEGDMSGARVVGDRRLGGALLQALHEWLFGPIPPAIR